MSTTKPLKTKPEAKTKAVHTPAPRPMELAVTTNDAFPLAQLYYDYENARNGGKELHISDIPPAVVESIRTKGIVNPLNIRRISDSERAEHKIPAQFTHIPWGGNSRRCVALHLGMIAVPARDYGQISRELAAKLADLDNCQRTDLTPSERIRNYDRLCKKHGWSYWNEADPSKSLGHKFALGGKSQSYAWARLAGLPKLAIEALDSKQLSVSVAVKLSGIFDKDSQKKAIEQAIRDRWTDDTASNVIRERYTAELKGVEFDPDDATLPGPDGKPLACEKCPFRSGNQADFTGQRGDICGKPSCLKGKSAEQFKRDAEKHRKDGGVVWTATQAKAAGLGQYGSYDNLDWKYCDISDSGYISRLSFDAKKRPLADLLVNGFTTKDLIFAQSPATGSIYRILPTALVKKLLKEKGLIKEEKPDTSYDDREKQRRKKVAEGKEIVARVQSAIVRAITPEHAATICTVPFRLAVRTIADRLHDDNARDCAKILNMEPKTLKLHDKATHREMVPQFAATCEPLELVALWALMLTHTCPGYDGQLGITCWDDTAHEVCNWLVVDLKAELEKARKGAK